MISPVMVTLAFTVGLLGASVFWFSGMVMEYRASREISWECAGYSLLFLVLGTVWPFLF
jgi:hypothetical protein